jgi:hypothetical protein
MGFNSAFKGLSNQFEENAVVCCLVACLQHDNARPTSYSCPSYRETDIQDFKVGCNPIRHIHQIWQPAIFMAPKIRSKWK